MVFVILLSLGPVFVGLIVGLVWWIIRGRADSLAGPARSWTLLAGLVLVLLGAVVPLLNATVLLPFEIPAALSALLVASRFAWPLAVGLMGIVLLGLPVRPRRGSGMAQLARRTPLSFVRPSWMILTTTIVAVLLAVSLTAGAASQPDPETGRYTMYFVPLGGERAMGTGIYGWFYSLPCLLLVAALVAVMFLDLFLISAPAIDSSAQEDVRQRTVRSRNVLAAAGGALVVHLGLVLASLAGTASIRSQFPTGEGIATFWTTFAALEPALRVLSWAAITLGFASWATVLLSAAASRPRVPTGAA
ncbi:hypothetical protein GCM10022219_06700 [Microbacterium oryzae]|uniref:Uncharacterized protein n=1 Tax=Microbacterium oryzae TaxID=743009 RepID=A0A6I6E4N2_9MICO|nr:hypothetical protein [Microbacterium oryzae]QGU26771.1 hypothetical protein D7D94_03135 [Microbacterium oryzae]